MVSKQARNTLERSVLDHGSFVPGYSIVYLRYEKFREIANHRVCYPTRLGSVACGALRRSNGYLAQNRQKSHRSSLDLVRGSAGRCALLWLDRWAESCL